MMVSADRIVDRARKILLLRRGLQHREAGVDRTLELARLCHRFSLKWQARGNSIIEHVYGGKWPAVWR